MTKKIFLIGALALISVACNSTKNTTESSKKEEAKPQPKPTTVESERDSRGNYVK